MKRLYLNFNKLLKRCIIATGRIFAMLEKFAAINVSERKVMRGGEHFKIMTSPDSLKFKSNHISF